MAIESRRKGEQFQRRYGGHPLRHVVQSLYFGSCFPAISVTLAPGFAVYRVSASPRAGLASMFSGGNLHSFERRSHCHVQRLVRLSLPPAIAPE